MNGHLFYTAGSSSSSSLPPANNALNNQTRSQISENTNRSNIDIPIKRKRGRPRKQPEPPGPTDGTRPEYTDERFANIICPICSKIIPGDETDANIHIDKCIENKFEPKPVARSVPMEDALVNVLDGDESRYGRPQYSDRDVAAVLSNISNAIELGCEIPFRRNSVDALLKTVQLQDQIIQRIPRCLICLDPHRKPVVSTVCWHVFCEQCWLQAIGSKRVCPHCSSITSPEDLRRVYL